MLKIIPTLEFYFLLLGEFSFLSFSEGLDCYSCLYEPVLSVETVQSSTHRIFLDKKDYQSCLDYTKPDPKLKRQCELVELDGKEILPVCMLVKAETGIIMGKVSHSYEVIARGCFYPKPNIINGNTYRKNKLTCSRRTFSNLTRLSARPMEGALMTVGKYSNRNKTMKFCYCSSDNCNQAAGILIGNGKLVVVILLLRSFIKF